MSMAVRGVEAVPLAADELDAIAELFNIGMGQASASLGAMVGEEVILSIPSVVVTTRALIAHALEPETEGRVCAVGERFHGPFTGEAMLVFPQGGGLALVGRLVPVDPAAVEPGEVEQDALTEIGNIILNGCLASIANLLDGPLVEGSIPEYRVGPPVQLIGETADPMLLVRITVGMAAGDAGGDVLFLLDLASLDGFRAAVARLLAGVR